ncbi:MAG: hypothetical protein ACOCZ8_07160, partial [Bacteroidota bacterium]
MRFTHTIAQRMSRPSPQNDASRQARLLFQVLDKLPVALFAFRPDGKPAFANRAARELFGKKKLVNAGEFVAHFNLKLATDGETYPNDRFPLTQVLDSDGETGISVDDVLLPDSTQPDRRWQVQAAPQRTNDGELELVLLFLEPELAAELTDAQLQVQQLEQRLSSKQLELNQLRADNEQLNLELQHATQPPLSSEMVETPIEERAESSPTPDQDADDTAEAPGTP